MTRGKSTIQRLGPLADKPNAHLPNLAPFSRTAASSLASRASRRSCRRFSADAKSLTFDLPPHRRSRDPPSQSRSSTLEVERSVRFYFSVLTSQFSLLSSKF